MTRGSGSDGIQTTELLLLVLKLLCVLVLLRVVLCDLLLVLLLLLLLLVMLRRHEGGRRERQRPGLVLLGVLEVRRLAMRVELVVAVQGVERVKIIRIHICGGGLVMGLKLSWAMLCAEQTRNRNPAVC